MAAANIIFIAAISAAVLAVVLLALVSPVPNKSRTNESDRGPWLTLSLYIHPPPRRAHDASHPQPSSRAPSTGAAFVFRQRLTDGPSNASRVLGSARGIIVPLPPSEMSVFNVLHLTLDGPGPSGSLCLEAMPGPVAMRRGAAAAAAEFLVVGGTGSFAFSRGHATLTASSGGGCGQGSCQLKLWLRFPG